MIATYVAATKEFLNSESVNSSTFAKRLRDIIAEHLVELNTAASTVDLGTTSLISEVSQMRDFSPQHIPIPILLLRFQIHNSKDIPDEGINGFVNECIFFLSRVTPSDLSAIIVPEIVAIAHTVTEHLCAKKNGESRVFIRILLHLVSIMQPNDICLTPIHADFLQACISGQMYRKGYELVKNFLVLEINVEKTCIQPSDVLKYFYYAGICCVGMRDYDAALENFIQILSVPGHNLSAIAVAAYKKAALVAVLATGKKLVPPRYASSTVSKAGKNCKDYDEVVRKFTDEKNLEELLKFVNENAASFAKDNNLGLVKRFEDAFIRHKFKILSKTYITLSINDIGKSVGETSTVEVKNWLMRLGLEGEMDICIDAESKMVYFNKPKNNLNRVNTKQIEEYLEEVNEVSNRARQLHCDIIVSPRYISKTSGNKSVPSNYADGRDDSI